jgi:hypothetical protein
VYVFNVKFVDLIYGIKGALFTRTLTSRDEFLILIVNFSKQNTRCCFSIKASFVYLVIHPFFFLNKDFSNCREHTKLNN